MSISCSTCRIGETCAELMLPLLRLNPGKTHWVSPHLLRPANVLNGGNRILIVIRLVPMGQRCLSPLLPFLPHQPPPWKPTARDYQRIWMAITNTINEAKTIQTLDEILADKDGKDTRLRTKTLGNIGPGLHLPRSQPPQFVRGWPQNTTSDLPRNRLSSSHRGDSPNATNYCPVA